MYGKTEEQLGRDCLARGLAGNAVHYRYMLVYLLAHTAVFLLVGFFLPTMRKIYVDPYGGGRRSPKHECGASKPKSKLAKK